MSSIRERILLGLQLVALYQSKIKEGEEILKNIQGENELFIEPIQTLNEMTAIAVEELINVIERLAKLSDTQNPYIDELQDIDGVKQFVVSKDHDFGTN